MLFLIGLGLGDAKDITVKGLEILRKCDRVYLEAYTSILISSGTSELEEFYGKKIILADRDMVETAADVILDGAKDVDVAFLVVGDPFGATTHSDLVLRAKELGIGVRAVHNASIMNAVGCTGLHLYSFGETVSIPFWTSGWKPQSFFDKIVQNHSRDLHTLCLLDIKVKERSEENLIKGRDIFEPPRFMTTQQALEQIMACIDEKEKGSKPDKTTIGVAVARIGSDEQKLVAGTLEQLLEVDMGSPLHSLIICGKPSVMEEESLQEYRL